MLLKYRHCIIMATALHFPFPSGVETFVLSEADTRLRILNGPNVETVRGDNNLASTFAIWARERHYTVEITTNLTTAQRGQLYAMTERYRQVVQNQAVFNPQPVMRVRLEQELVQDVFDVDSATLERNVTLTDPVASFNGVDVAWRSYFDILGAIEIVSEVVIGSRDCNDNLQTVFEVKLALYESPAYERNSAATPFNIKYLFQVPDDEFTPTLYSFYLAGDRPWAERELVFTLPTGGPTDPILTSVKITNTGAGRDEWIVDYITESVSGPLTYTFVSVTKFNTLSWTHVSGVYNSSDGFLATAGYGFLSRQEDWVKAQASIAGLPSRTSVQDIFHDGVNLTGACGTPTDSVGSDPGAYPIYYVPASYESSYRSVPHNITIDATNPSPDIAAILTIGLVHTTAGVYLTDGDITRSGWDATLQYFQTLGSTAWPDIYGGQPVDLAAGARKNRYDYLQSVGTMSQSAGAATSTIVDIPSVAISDNAENTISNEPAGVQNQTGSTQVGAVCSGDKGSSVFIQNTTSERFSNRAMVSYRRYSRAFGQEQVDYEVGYIQILFTNVSQDTVNPANSQTDSTFELLVEYTTPLQQHAHLFANLSAYKVFSLGIDFQNQYQLSPDSQGYFKNQDRQLLYEPTLRLVSNTGAFSIVQINQSQFLEITDEQYINGVTVFDNNSASNTSSNAEHICFTNGTISPELIDSTIGGFPSGLSSQVSIVGPDSNFRWISIDINIVDSPVTTINPAVAKFQGAPGNVDG